MSFLDCMAVIVRPVWPRLLHHSKAPGPECLALSVLLSLSDHVIFLLCSSDIAERDCLKRSCVDLVPCLGTYTAAACSHA